MAVWEDDTTGKSMSELDGAHIVPGYYFAEIFKEEVEDKTAAEVLHVRITGPTFAGAIKEVKMNNPKYENDPKKQDELRRRSRSVAVRTGVLPKDTPPGPVKFDWSRAVGWKGLFVIVADPKTQEDGKVINYTKPDYLPFFPLDHDAIPVEVRHALGLKLLPGQVATPTVENGHTPAKGKRKGKGDSADDDGPGTPKKALGADEI